MVETALPELTRAGLGQDEPAPRLFGAVEVLRERTGAFIANPAKRQLRDERVTALRARLAPEAFAAARSAGRAPSRSEAIAAALAASD